MPIAKYYYLIEPKRYEEMTTLQQNTTAPIKETNPPTPMETLEHPTKTNPFIHPNLKAVYELDKDMKSILSSETLSEHDKVNMYNEKLAYYLNNYKSALNVPKKEALLGESKPAEVIDEKVPHQEKSIDDAQLISNLPLSYRRKGKVLLKRLADDKSNIKVLPSGEIAYKGKTIHSSNIEKLLNAAVRSKPTDVITLPGYEEFLKQVKHSSVETVQGKKPIPAAKFKKEIKQKKQAAITSWVGL